MDFIHQRTFPDNRKLHNSVDDTLTCFVWFIRPKDSIRVSRFDSYDYICYSRL